MITKQQRKTLLFIEPEMERSGGVAQTIRVAMLAESEGTARP